MIFDMMLSGTLFYFKRFLRMPLGFPVFDLHRFLPEAQTRASPRYPQKSWAYNGFIKTVETLSEDIITKLTACRVLTISTFSRFQNRL